jgi:hypothetical protein
MDWFIVKNVFQIVTGAGVHRPQFEERMVLIEAATEMEAYHKAKIVGKKAEDAFVNVSEELVTWTFINTAQVHLVANLADGVTLCVRTEEPDHVADYLRWVNEGQAFELQPI